MDATQIKAGFVRTIDGGYLVQLPADNRWGFELTDGDQSWPGGHGIASTWALVPESDVPAEVRDALGWILAEAE